MALPTCSELLRHALSPDEPMVLALAGTIGNAPLRPTPYDLPLAGIDREEMERLARRFFPSLDPARLTGALPQDTPASERQDEFEDLSVLLLEHRRDDDESIAWTAMAIATASMGGNHLWQDMGLPDRGVLNRLIEHCFPSLHARNSEDMKWKKFFYRQLCEQAEVLICKSPSCSECVDYALCFGREDDADPIRFEPRK